jgi:hypothetical protein
LPRRPPASLAIVRNSRAVNGPSSGS